MLVATAIVLILAAIVIPVKIPCWQEEKRSSGKEFFRGDGLRYFGRHLSYPKMKFEQFASAWGLVFSAGYILITPATGLVLDAMGHYYQMTFIVSGVLALAGALAFLVLHRFFMELGGPEHYQPPLLKSLS